MKLSEAIQEIAEAGVLTQAQLRAIFTKNRGKMRAASMNSSEREFTTRRITIVPTPALKSFQYKGVLGGLQSPGSPLRQKIAKLVRDVRKQPKDKYGLGLRKLMSGRKLMALHGSPDRHSSQKRVTATVFPNVI